ncbi:hypothetical protein ES703_84767 [subsurface metagenome]
MVLKIIAFMMLWVLVCLIAGAVHGLLEERKRRQEIERKDE